MKRLLLALFLAPAIAIAQLIPPGAPFAISNTGNNIPGSGPYSPATFTPNAVLIGNGTGPILATGITSSAGGSALTAAAATDLTLNAGSGNQGINLNPTGTGIVTVNYTPANFAAGVTTPFNLNITGAADVGGTSDVRAINISSIMSGANAASNLAGLNVDVRNSSSNSTDAQIVSANLRATSTGAIGNGYGFRVIPILSAAGNMTQWIGFQARTPSRTSTGTLSTAYGFYAEAQKVTGVTTGYGIYSAGASDLNVLFGHLLLGGLTTDGTGVLQFPAATTNAGGINFGTDAFLYRLGAGVIALASGNGFRADFIAAVSGGSLVLQSGAGPSAALTLDSSQNATFAGTAKATGFLNTTGTSANSGNGLTQRFRNGYGTAGQAPSATTRTYVTGSDVGPFTAGQIVVGTMIHWHLDITKTAAGTATAVFDIAFGTNGTTGDTAQVSFTKPAGVAQIDHCGVDIYATVKTNSASGVVLGDFTLSDDQSNVLGGFLAAAKWVSSISVTSGTFNTTTPTHIGLCVTTGASDAWTINSVQTWTSNI